MEYTVVSGDRVAVDRPGRPSIATRFHVRAAQLAEANPGLDPDLLRIGQTITIPLTAPRLTLRLETARLRDIRATLPHSNAAERRIVRHETENVTYTMEQLAPTIRDAVTRWVPVADRARVFLLIACIIRQESRDMHTPGAPTRNWHTHDDGTGTGLIGLDPAGHLEEFRRWAAPGSDGRFPADRTLRLRRPPPPELQIWYLARILSELKAEYGSWDAATRAWHTGHGSSDASGDSYLENVTARRADVRVRF